MRIATKFNFGDRVGWFSDQYQKELTGTIVGLTIEYGNLDNIDVNFKDKPSTDYRIHCDEKIKSSNTHIINEADKIAKLMMLH